MSTTCDLCEGPHARPTPPSGCNRCWRLPERSCVECGVLFRPYKQNAKRRKTGKFGKYCSPACNGKALRRSPRRAFPISIKSCKVWVCDCAACGQAFTSHGRKYCSDACSKQGLRASQKRRQIRSRKDPLPAIDCVECGKPFVPRSARNRFCSPSCNKRAHRRTEKVVRRDRKRDNSRTVEAIFRARIYERDGFRCQLCGKKIDRKAAVPDPLAGVLDHVVPLSRGGGHTYANLQTAHFICNSLKSDGLFGEQPEQLRLVG